MKDSPSDTRWIRADKRSRKRLLQDTEPSYSRAIHTESDEQGEPLLSARGLQQQFEELQRQRDALLTEKTSWENEKTVLLKKAESAFERIYGTYGGKTTRWLTHFHPTHLHLHPQPHRHTTRLKHIPPYLLTFHHITLRTHTCCSHTHHHTDHQYYPHPTHAPTTSPTHYTPEHTPPHPLTFHHITLRTHAPAISFPLLSRQLLPPYYLHSLNRHHLPPLPSRYPSLHHLTLSLTHLHPPALPPLPSHLT
ncbi:hypothetical protein Pcinc_012684 [Petrolisthes cinctipes]|uniref:Uncharacterized protein n=1 Tax=Petrolisthes cinctipes TaxID=88211 RepID=A0AAE1G470_PETCI|nr:hypothetical protein Pcinc_012684 [Petrolisthes cinctipes]